MKRRLFLLLVVALAAGYVAWACYRPLPRLKPFLSTTVISAKVPASNLAGPATGQAAVGIKDTSILRVQGAQRPVPTASTAKLITALSVLNKKPLKPGQQGPVITLGPSDVALFNSYNAQGGSVVPVVAGEQITEYQMLQMLMLPSANNMADSLAIWAFGSLKAYADYANTYVTSLAMESTHVGSDASGLAPDTTSTAMDMVRLGEAAMSNPVLAGIVGQQTATGLPVVNTVKNVNFLLGTDNIVGIKTGNSDEAGGAFVGAATATVNGKKVTIVTAVLGSPTLFTAMKDSLNFINSAQTSFKPVTVVKAGTVVGSYRVPWGGVVPAATASDLSTTGWTGDTVTATGSLQDVPPDSRSGQTAGRISIPQSAMTDSRSAAIKLQGTPGAPSIWWRLAHPF